MIPQDQMDRLTNELEMMTVDGLKALQILPDNILWRTLAEGLRINRYRCRRSMTANMPISAVRELIQETILDKIYDEMLEKIQQ